MKSRPIRVWLVCHLGVALLGVALLGVAPLWALGPSDTDESCARARGLLESGLLAEARTALSQSGQASACHREVLGELAKRYRLRGEALLEAGATDEARKSFLTSLAIQPRGNRAKIELRRIHRTADPFDAARHLLEVGDVSAARTAALEVVKKNPSRALPKDLQPLFAGGWQGWWKLRRWALGWLPTVLEVFLVLLGSVLLVVLVWGLFRRLLRRRVIFEAFEGQVPNAPAGAGLARLVQSHLVDLSGGRSDPSARLIRAKTEATQLPEVAGKIFPLAGPLVSALNAVLSLISRSPYKISGHTHRAGPRGLGLTLQLSEGETILQSVSLWESDFARSGSARNAAASLYLLTQMGAVWVLFQLRDRWKPREPFQYLGSRSWRAVALFRAGVGAHDVDDTALASECYRGALRLDPGLYAAQVNLAWLVLQQDRASSLQLLESVVNGLVQRKPEDAKSSPAWPVLITRLESVAAGEPGEVGATEADGLQSFERNPWYYQARYGLLFLYVENLLDQRGKVKSRPENEALFERSLAEAKRFPGELQSALRKLAAAREGARRSPAESMRDVEADLRRVALLAQPVLASLEVLTREPEIVPPGSEPSGTERRIQAMQQRALLGADGTFAYNVACLLSLYCMRKDEDLPCGDEIEAAIECLKIASRAQRYRAEATTDPALLHLASTDAYKAYKQKLVKPPPQPSKVAKLASRWRRRPRRDAAALTPGATPPPAGSRPPGGRGAGSPRA